MNSIGMGKGIFMIFVLYLAKKEEKTQSLIEEVSFTHNFHFSFSILYLITQPSSSRWKLSSHRAAACPLTISSPRRRFSCRTLSHCQRTTISRTAAARTAVISQKLIMHNLINQSQPTRTRPSKCKSFSCETSPVKTLIC